MRICQRSAKALILKVFESAVERLVNNPGQYASLSLLCQMNGNALWMIWPLILAGTHLCHGQQRLNIHDGQQWIQHYQQIDLDKAWHVAIDGGFRWRDGFSTQSQYIIRGAMGYAIGGNVSVRAGLAHLGFYRASSLDRIEVRPYQELKLRQEFGKFKLSHRYRAEQRFMSLLEAQDDRHRHHFNWRFRYAISATMPVFTFHTGQKVLLTIGNEVFVNAGREVVDRFFAQNRLIISPSYKPNKNLRLALTWNYQFASTSEVGRFVHSQVLWLQTHHRFGLKNG